MPAPGVSVIVPTYQRRELVRRAVATVLAQTYRDFELIVIDDGSTDGTREALEPLAGRLVYRWQANAGVSAARNAGLRLARAPVVAFLDSDNRWLPEHLGVLTAVLDRRPEAVLASTCPRFVVGGRDAPADARLEDSGVPLLTRVRVGHLSCVAVRRAALDEAGGFDERMPAYEDIDLWSRLALLGPFATVRRRTVIRQATPGSLRDSARRDGSYLAAAELSAEGLVAAARRRNGTGGDAVVAEARSALHLARAVRAVDRHDAAAARAELARACALGPLGALPEEAEAPFRRHLSRAEDPVERMRALRMVAEAWPDPRADSARFVRLLAAAAAVRAGRPAEAAALLGRWPVAGSLGFARRVAPVLRRRAARTWQEARHRGAAGQAEGGRPRAAALVQRVMLRTGAGPLRPVWRVAYSGVARIAGLYFVRGVAGAGVYLRGSFATGEPVLGVSDLDFAVLVPGDAEHAVVEERWQRLKGRAPALAGTVLDRPKVHTDDALAAVLAATTLTHGLDRPLEPASRERRRAERRAERPGLYGPLTLRDWRHVAGRDRRPAVAPWGEDGRRITAWLEVQYWWMQAFRTCVAPSRPWAAVACVKLMTEPLRAWLWAAHGERVAGRRELAARVRALRPDMAEVVERAERLAGRLHRSPHPPLREALGALLDGTALLAGALAADAERSGGVEVRLTGAATALPLADWRAIVWPPATGETLSLADDDPGDPTALAALAERQAGSHFRVLRRGGLLVLPSITGARLRGAQCVVTDPVSFALLDGRDSARFADLRGWRASDVAHRAVAEHLGWLRCAEAPYPPARLLSASRAAFFHESLAAGAPELLLTDAAVAERLGADGDDLLPAVRELPCYRT